MRKSKTKQIVAEIKAPVAIKDFRSLWIPAVAIISFGLSIFNNYALDDFIVIVKNKFTQHGFSGIWDILSHDSFAGMTASDVAGLAGVRYRPLSLVTFAIEQQFFNGSPFISHLINVILYAFSGILLFKWLLLFRTTIGEIQWKKIAFATSIIFIALPVHSESVINIKGRDDLLCLLFFLLASIQLLRYANTSAVKNLSLSAFYYFFSLLSKETAITFLAVFPIMLLLFSDASGKKIITSSALLGAIACLFLLFRYFATKNNSGIMSDDVLNNPFINATLSQRYATILLSWLLYMKLIIFPLHLSYDYNFNQVPLIEFRNWMVILSIAINLLLLVFAFYFFRKKPLFAFSIFFYFITFSLVSNFFFTTGTPLAERFVLIPTIGFCLACSVLFYEAFERLKKRGLRLKPEFIFLLIILSFYSIRNISRCSDWKDNNTLFLADVKSTPGSAKSQLNAGLACLNLANENTGEEKNKWIDESLTYLQQGIRIYPKKIDGYINMGVAYSWKKDFENAEFWWNKARVLNPASTELEVPNKVLAEHFFRQGMEYATKKNLNASISSMRHALQYDSLNTEILFNLGGAYYTIQNADSAVYYFQKTLFLNPSYPNAENGLHAAMNIRRFY